MPAGVQAARGQFPRRLRFLGSTGTGARPDQLPGVQNVSRHRILVCVALLSVGLAGCAGTLNNNGVRIDSIPKGAAHIDAQSPNYTITWSVDPITAVKLVGLELITLGKQLVGAFAPGVPAAEPDAP